MQNMRSRPGTLVHSPYTAYTVPPAPVPATGHLLQKTTYVHARHPQLLTATEAAVRKCVQQGWRHQLGQLAQAETQALSLPCPSDV
jgi:hypothetical protein